MLCLVACIPTIPAVHDLFVIHRVHVDARPYLSWQVICDTEKYI